MRGMLLRYSFEPRPKGRVLVTLGSVMTIDQSINGCSHSYGLRSVSSKVWHDPGGASFSPPNSRRSKRISARGVCCNKKVKSWRQLITWKVEPKKANEDKISEIFSEAILREKKNVKFEILSRGELFSQSTDPYMCQESSVDVKIPFFYYFCIVKVNGLFLWQNRFAWAWRSLCTTGYSPIPLLTSVCVAVKPNLCALVSFQRNWDRCLLRWWPRMWRHQPVKLAHSRWLWVLLMPSLGSCWWRYGGFTVMHMCYRKFPLISPPPPPFLPLFCGYWGLKGLSSTLDLFLPESIFVKTHI